MAESTFQRWVRGVPSSGDDVDCGNLEVGNEAGACSHQKFRKLLLFSGNDYLGLSTHPVISKAAAKAALAHGMGPKGSALICGYTNYHILLESCMADLKSKEDCLLCPTGFAANMALMTTLGSVGSLFSTRGKPLKDDRVAIFSDALNHASMIDGIRLAERQGSVVAFVYRHCDMSHLNALLLRCPMKKKVVVTDSLFSRDGDFAPMGELSKLRKRHGFLLVIDDAHGMFVCGKNGGGVDEELNCESNVDLCVGTLSKAAGCHGGFIACSKRWKQLIQSTGRSFIFSTFTRVPIAAAAHAAVILWPKRGLGVEGPFGNGCRTSMLSPESLLQVASPLVVGSEQKALQASGLFQSLFLSLPLEIWVPCTAIRPPAVPPNSCRLRVTLSAARTLDDLKKLTAALSECINFRDIIAHSTNGHTRL
ncbi:hypothetical protein RHMOL_Rhmol03G0189900 [Rhododendron molle]|uniref:Uncharacterized protein n=1 Tax=Rhododendron molle TaxID=49168 RepID=A0ACC0PJ62_RHOML|nr:hypothetical protein RHMOL_Rhmol03G0189900 [Rhododendron molle]